MEGKLPGIQVGRAIAAMAVFYFHSYIALTYFDQSKLATNSYLASYGASGVDFFFALSGFIVCYVAARPDFTTSSFLLKRFFRIFPLNAAVTIAIALVAINGIRITDDPSLAHVIKSLLILPQTAPINSVGWTLEYEIAFYVLAAVLLPIGGPRLLLLYCILSYLIGLFWAPEAKALARLITEKHGAFGAGIAAFMIVSALPKLNVFTAWIAAVVLGAIALSTYWLGTRIGYMTPLACGVAVIGFALMPYAPRWAVHAGDISYGFYLLHWPLIGYANYLSRAVVAPHPSAGELWRWNTFIYIWLVAHLLWLYFEQPINRWARSLGKPSQDTRSP